MHKKVLAAAVAALVVALGACATTPFDKATAVAKLDSTRGNGAAGTVTFAERMGKVYVTAEVTGLAPGKEHGFHMHEKGDCSSGDGMSTGGHWNPDATPHGPQSGPHHAGDMPSLLADANGVAKTSFTLEGVTVVAGPRSVVGRGLIVHKDPDDYKTQPTGNAGVRVACAVITAS